MPHLYIHGISWDYCKWFYILILKFCTDKHFSNFQTFDIPFLYHNIGSVQDTKDEEKQQGLPVGMLNDRDKVNKPGSQHGPLAIEKHVTGAVNLMKVFNTFPGRKLRWNRE